LKTPDDKNCHERTALNLVTESNYLQILFQEKISSQQEFGQKKMRFKRLSEIQMEGTLPSFGPKIFPKVQKVVPSNFQEVVKVQVPIPIPVQVPVPPSMHEP
jgi:hypothetical protein